MEAWARSRGFEPAQLRAGAFELFVLVRHSARSETLVIYIEGDGAPWSGPYRPPGDPTPRQPLALALANADPASAVAWLGRPCQYLDAAALGGCDRRYWMERRFAPEVVSAYDGAVSRLKTAAGAQRVRLVGFSGGGVIAALLGARRSDIDRLVTVAAPLALSEWTAWHGLSPLAGSIDPIEERGGYAGTDVHFAGANDGTVPPALVERFVRAKGGRLVTVAGFDHGCCWARDWRLLLDGARRGGGDE